MALACRLPDRDALAQLRRTTGVELLLVHLEPPLFGRPIGPYACPPASTGLDAPPQAPWDRAAWEGLARAGRDDVQLVARDGDALLFRVR